MHLSRDSSNNRYAKTLYLGIFIPLMTKNFQTFFASFNIQPISRVKTFLGSLQKVVYRGLSVYIEVEKILKP